MKSEIRHKFTTIVLRHVSDKGYEFVILIKVDYVNGINDIINDKS